MAAVTMKKGEIFTIVMLILLVIVVAIPNFMKDRVISCKNACPNCMRLIDAAKEQAAADYGWDAETDCDIPTNKIVVNKYLKDEKTPECPANGTYTYGRVGEKTRWRLKGIRGFISGIDGGKGFKMDMSA